ncbi:hypothetical protein D8M04_19130 [Oceanobacillus piezotolerans]|uniref:Uncharacterized protein n=1 Tax=Oceanobacillus piezotolerans TaxID=2448030 RepID=A0A498D177_9BACI|nr:hypothetical protein [Oceanobacillus piezotolerans]RLL40354.1 hypothetical protein D8M04_19130 [Oceanobacillus piezotolerans]
MGRQIKGLLYYYWADQRHNLMIFWSILLSILVVSVFLSDLLLSEEVGSVYFGFPFATYFYAGIFGFLSVKEKILYSLKIGATRKNIFISLGIFFFLLSLTKAVFSSMVQQITIIYMEAVNHTTFNFLHFAALLEDTFINRIVLDTAIMFLLMTISLIIGLSFNRFGLLGAGSFIGVIAIVLLLGTAQGWLIDWIVDTLSGIDMTFFYQMIVVSAILYIGTFLFIRRITTVKLK